MKKLAALILIACMYHANAQIPTSWNSRGPGGGGALFSPSVNPGNDQEYYINCDMTEQFRTTNFGLSYTQADFNELQAGAYSRVAFTNSTVRYTVNIASDISIPVKSSDGGATWNPLPGNPGPSEVTYSIYADYNNSNRVVISYYNQIYFSLNGGTSFTNIHNANNSGAGVVIGGVFFDGNNIYIGTNDGIIVSANGGTSFSVQPNTGIAAGQALWSFAGAKQNGITRFFCLTGNTGDIYVGLPGYDYWQFLKGVYAMDFGVTNWTSKMNGINVSSDFLMYVAMAENNIDKAYLGGSNSSGEPHILKTINGGTSWTDIFNTSLNQNIVTGWSGASGDRTWGYGECVLGFAVAPLNADKVIFTDFGFAHVTSDGGANWRQAYIPASDQNPAGTNTPKGKAYGSIGLENTTCWQILWIDSLNMFSCYSDIKAVRSTDGGKKWSFNYTGNDANSMYRIVKNPSNSNLFAATSGIHDMYQSTRLQDATLDATDSYGKIIYSTNNGSAWQQLHYFGHPVFWLALDPNNNNRAYASVVHYANGAGVGGVYRCDDLQNLTTSTWTRLPNPPRTQGHPASIVVLNDGKVVCTYSGRRASNGAFTNSSGCFIYDPNSNSWSDVSDAGMFYWTKDIVVDPTDPSQNTWFAGVFSGWGGPPNGLGGLYRTTNRGTSWTKINSLDRVTSITFNPLNNDMIYMTTEQNGLWYSMNIHNASPAFAQVSNYKFRQPERVFFNPYQPGEVWVSSFGNGMKTGNLCGNFSAHITALGPTTFCKPGSVTLSASNATGLIYQWLKGGSPVAGATSSDYVATLGGNYKCVVTNASGCTKTSNKILVTAQNCLKVNDADNLNEAYFNVYPNPANDHITIQSSILREKITITNTLGQKIIEVSSVNTVDVSKLNPGIYLVKAIDKNNSQLVVKYFIKQ